MSQGDPAADRIPSAELAWLELCRRQATGAAHTLNNVFTSLLGELALLADECKDDPVVDEAVAALRSQLERCVKLVRNGLARPAPSASRTDEVDLGLLLSRALCMLEGTLPRRIGLRAQVPDEAWVARGDAAELEVLLLSLVFRLGDLVPGGCMNVAISLAEGDAAYTLALHFDLEARDLPADARQRLVDPRLAEDATRAAALQAVHEIADHHGTHLRTERTGEDALRLTLQLPRLDA